MLQSGVGSSAHLQPSCWAMARHCSAFPARFTVTLKNVNGRERDTSAAASWHREQLCMALEAFRGWGNEPYGALSEPDHRDVLTVAKHAVPSEGHTVRPVLITL